MMKKIKRKQKKRNSKKGKSRPKHKRKSRHKKPAGKFRPKRQKPEKLPPPRTETQAPNIASAGNTPVESKLKKSNQAILKTLPLSENQQELVVRLIALGKKQGYLTYEQINNLLPQEITESEKIEGVITALSAHNIEITTSPIQQESEGGAAGKKEKTLEEEKEPEEFERFEGIE